MKKFTMALGMALTLSAISMPSHAGGVYKQNFLCHYFSYKCQANKPADKPAKPAHAVPEIDAANAALALALMGGIVSISRERRKRKA